MVVLPQPHRRTLPRRMSRIPIVMGIVNVTPDSFSDGGACLNPDTAIRRGIALVEQGADWIDVGGESTRPGSSRVSITEELQRVMPVIQGLVEAVDVPISIDTSKASVAAAALQAGASIVNDVTALRGDAAMGSIIARANARVILMHMRGTPSTMQRRPSYHHVVQEVAAFLKEAIARAKMAGIRGDHILVDPGLGFGKTVRHNLQLLHGLAGLTSAGVPVVVGASRKSFIGHILDAEIPERLAGSLACAAWAYHAGAAVVRVHDVRETVELLQILHAIESEHKTHR